MTSKRKNNTDLMHRMKPNGLSRTAEAQPWLIHHQAKYFMMAQDPEAKFPDFYNLVRQPHTLWMALHEVLAHPGSRTPGVDGENKWSESLYCSGGDWAARESLHQGYCDALELELRGEYNAAPLRSRPVPRPAKSDRVLGIPTLRDRVVQTALKFFLDPIFEPLFSDRSHGYRPGRNTSTAIGVVTDAIENRPGPVHVLRADIADCFPSVPHDELISALSLRVTDKKVLALVREFLAAGFAGNLDPTVQGLHQGAVLSPLLINIYLTMLDAAAAGFGPGLQYARWADDIVFIGMHNATEAEQVRQSLGRFLAHLGLRLSPPKTTVSEASAGFEFIGHFIQRDSGGRCLVRPTGKNITRFRDRVTGVLDRHSQDESPAHALRELKSELASFASTFHRDTSLLDALDDWVETSVVHWLIERGFPQERGLSEPGTAGRRISTINGVEVFRMADTAPPAAPQRPPWMGLHGLHDAAHRALASPTLIALGFEPLPRPACSVPCVSSEFLATAQAGELSTALEACMLWYGYICQQIAWVRSLRVRLSNERTHARVDLRAERERLSGVKTRRVESNERVIATITRQCNSSEEDLRRLREYRKQTRRDCSAISAQITLRAQELAGLNPPVIRSRRGVSANPTDDLATFEGQFAEPLHG